MKPNYEKVEPQVAAFLTSISKSFEEVSFNLTLSIKTVHVKTIFSLNSSQQYPKPTFGLS